MTLFERPRNLASRGLHELSKGVPIGFQFRVLDLDSVRHIQYATKSSVREIGTLFIRAHAYPHPVIRTAAETLILRGSRRH
jgi:hypothetical protein